MSDHSDDNESEDEVFMDDLDLSKPRPSNSTLKSTHPLPSSQPAPKWVLHVDVDCFYAQSSYLRIFADMEEEPPIAMRQKHIIVTANYPARALGIRKLMSYEAAKKIDTKLGGGILKFVDASDLTVFREDAFAIETSIRTWTCPVQKKGEIGGDIVSVDNESHAQSFFQTGCASSLITAINLTPHPNPFCDSLRSWQGWTSST